jgi:hypothetical protein
MPVSILSPGSDVASAEQVRAAREGRGWTLDEMADAVHASPAGGRRVRSGHHPPARKAGLGVVSGARACRERDAERALGSRWRSVRASLAGSGIPASTQADAAGPDGNW